MAPPQREGQVDDRLDERPLARRAHSEQGGQLGGADQQRAGVDEAVQHRVRKQIGKMGQTQGAKGHLQDAGQQRELHGQHQPGFGAGQGQG